MKKTFKLTHPKTQVDRLVDSARSEIRKYLKRERRRVLPEGADFWDFACRSGPSEEQAQTTHVDDLGKWLGAAAEKNLESFYIEVIAKPGQRKKKPDSKASE